ncbi:MAG TPA: gamma-glutamyltransferase [Chloroflexota bacterium]|nr:gamma-glutamyltransferase [Chloroflexota bacterium]
MAERTRSETVPGGAPDGPAGMAGRPARTDTISVIPDVHDHDHDPLAAPGAAGAPNGQARGQEAAFVGRPTIRAQRYMISSVHYLATMGGLRILSGGGNAIDAGVAAGICINVVQPQLAMFGGVAPIIISPAPAPPGAPPGAPGGSTSDVVTISGLGRWPHAARLEDYLARYGGDLPAGIPRTVTPAAPDAWLTALAEFGTMSLAEVLQPALELAEGGFPLHAELQAAIASAARPGGAFSRYPSTAAAFLPDGRVPQVGEVFRQPQLGHTFRRLIEAERGAGGDREARIGAARDLLYRGELARQIATFYREQGSLLTENDLAQFRVRLEPPAHATYRDLDVYTCGPWCQGPSLLLALNLLEGLNLRGMGPGSAPYLHTVAEALNLAFADRHAYFGDPDFVDVPLRGLLSKEYAGARRDLIRPGQAWPEMPPAGDPWAFPPGANGPAAAGAAAGAAGTSGGAPLPANRGAIEGDTSYVCVVDGAGNGFSATPSDSVFGSPVVPGLGFAVSNRGTQSWLDPAHPSSLAPWKRPRLTPNPALARRDGRVAMTFGCPGGDAQVQGMLQVFLNVVEHGMDLQGAIEAPRICSQNFPNSFWPHVYHPGRLDAETRIPPPVRDDLAALGHAMHASRAWGGVSLVCAITVDPSSGVLSGGADPRAESYAAGW